MKVYFTWLNETTFEVNAVYWRTIDVLPLLKGTSVFEDIVAALTKQALVGIGNEEAV